MSFISRPVGPSRSHSQYQSGQPGVKLEFFQGHGSGGHSRMGCGVLRDPQMAHQRPSRSETVADNQCGGGVFGFTDRPGALDTLRLGFEETGRRRATCWQLLPLSRCRLAPAAPPIRTCGRGGGGRVRGRTGDAGFTLRIGAHSCHSQRVGLFF